MLATGGNFIDTLSTLYEGQKNTLEQTFLELCKFLQNSADFVYFFMRFTRILTLLPPVQVLPCPNLPPIDRNTQ